MPEIYPATEWDFQPPPADNDRVRLSAAVERGRRRGASAVMVVIGGRIAAWAGEVTQKRDMASARKSLLSALYGIYVEDGVIDTSLTLGELDIVEIDPLTDVEKRATIRDLLMARSGVYRVAAGESVPMKLARPRRGSHAPGEHWSYNNWDFNVLGTIFQQVTGTTVHEAFGERIAHPVGMQDYRVEDGFYRTTKKSLHRAYRFTMSARDMARFGLLMVRGGRWEGQQIVPADWVKESTWAHTPVARGPFGYGYSWWIGQPRDLDGHDFYLARGGRGDAIVVVPDLDLVVVHRVPRPGRIVQKLRLHELYGWITWRRVGPRPRRFLPPTTLNAILDAAIPVAARQ